MKPVITKLGTIDIFIIESNPVVFKGRLYRFEYIRNQIEGQRYRFNNTGDSYFRFVDVENGECSEPFGCGLHMGNAFVWENRLYVTAVEGWGKSRFYQLESDDMKHWTPPRVILENPFWEGYNTSLCRDRDGFMLTFELGAPKELVGTPFTMFFAHSKDLKTWEYLPDAVFGRNMYTGGPMLRFFGDWYYFFYLDGSYEKGFLQSVARSKDLKSWEHTPCHPVLDYADNDRKIRGFFSTEEQELIRTAVDVNNSDMDMCEWKNGLYIVYSWGNQRGTEFLAEARAEYTEREFCEGYF